jgi:hypothetical protein
MNAAADDWKKYLPRYIAEVEAEPGAAPALVLQIAAEERAQRRADLDYAVSNVLEADLDRLKKQMTHYATAPYWADVSAGLAAVSAEWNERGLMPAAPRIVWRMLQEDLKVERARASADPTNAPPWARDWREREQREFQDRHPNVVNILAARNRVTRRGRSQLPTREI